jgi:hypothetical protein
MRQTFAAGAATSGIGCPERVGRADRCAVEITLQRDNSSGRPPPKGQTIDYLDQDTIDYRDRSHSVQHGILVIRPAYCEIWCSVRL